jgi:hypothetical protein
MREREVGIKLFVIITMTMIQNLSNCAIENSLEFQEIRVLFIATSMKLGPRTATQEESY